MSGLPQAPTGALVDALGLTFPESEERFDRLVDAVTEYAIFTLDPDGAITSWNAGAERMKGYTRDEVLGRHFSMLYPSADRDAGLPQRLLDHARVAGSYQHEGWRIKKDGSRFWGDVVISVLLDDHACHAGFVKVVRDRSQQHRLEDAQDSFYNAFEHDFKMPITAIKGFAQLIVDADRKDQPYFVERVESNADRLLTIVDELVAYARLRSGLTPVRLQAIDLMSVAQLAVANLTTSAADMSRIHFAAAPPVRVVADPAALERVVANLVANALKYSSAQSSIDVLCETGAGVGVLMIADLGRGIDERDLGSIFLEFERGRLAQNDSGTGLGLASVQRLITLQKGTVAITSQVGVGTTVTIQLPLAT